jgi:replicative DNA helicase
MSESIFSDDLVERAVLGAILQDGSLIEFIDSFPDNVFASSSHRLIFSVLKDLRTRGTGIDVVSVSATLKDKNKTEDIGGLFYLTEIIESCPSVANFSEHSKLLLEKFSRRNLYSCVARMEVGLKSDTPVESLLWEFQHDLEKNVVLGAPETINPDNIEKKRKEIMLARLSNPRAYIMPGYPTMDEYMPYGFVRPGVSLIGGRPKSGKTTFVRNVVANICDAGHSVVIWSPEMGNTRELDLMAAVKMGVPFENFYNRTTLSDSVFIQRVKTFDAFWRDSWKLRIFDSMPMNSGEFLQKVYSLDAELKVDVLVIDMMDFFSEVLLEKDSARKSYTIAQILQRIVTFSFHRNIHTILIWQLSRQLEERKGKHKRPQLGDFGLSDAAIQKVDQIMTIYRESYYDPDSNDDFTEIIIGAQRGTRKTGTIKLYLSAGLRLEEVGRKPEDLTPF